MKQLPFVFIPLSKARKLAKKFYKIGRVLSKTIPSLEVNLSQLETDMNEVEYASIAVMTSMFYCVYTFFMILILSAAAPPQPFESILFIAVTTGVILFAGVLIYLLLYPSVLTIRKNNEIETNLLFAARQMMIQTTAGVPLYDALTTLTPGYGQVSKEVSKIITNVEGGMSLADALDKSALENPSLHYRRIFWQLSNATKAGADMSEVLSDVVDSLANEQRIALQRYGSQLSPLALGYMLTTIIGPTLGIVFLIVLTSFTAIPITDAFFWFVLGLLILVQIVFIGLIESRRPHVAL
ncbi:MAG: type II secretion system F family protein [Candidatus Micrarchaeota archaeon]